MSELVEGYWGVYPGITGYNGKNREKSGKIGKNREKSGKIGIYQLYRDLSGYIGHGSRIRIDLDEFISVSKLTK